MSYDRTALVKELEGDEGRVPYAHQDHKGYWTAGVGFLIDKDKGGRIPDAVIDFWLDYLVKEREKQLDQRLPWWRTLSDARQRAILNMAWQLGVSGLLGFPKMLRALQAGNWGEAYLQALDSKWARVDTPARAQRVAAMFLEESGDAR
jgi:lysozyme